LVVAAAETERCSSHAKRAKGAKVCKGFLESPLAFLASLA
jgi:hypothetical protein